jgi:ATP-dependent exoDNAse (exonuclease V) alpha subunit
MAKQLGGTLVRLKTDSVIVEDGNDVEFSSNKAPGTYKKETIPGKFYTSYSFIETNDYQLDTVQWNHTTSGSRFLTGGPGCGKSYKINEECKTIKNYIKLAPTNIVARDFEGLTLNSFFGIDIKYNCDKHKVLAQARKYRYIIIDEISLLFSKMLQILYYIKLNTKTEFILLGDYDQLDPIEDKNYDYRNSCMGFLCRVLSD